MEGMNINIGIVFKERIVPGVYKFDIVVTTPPCCGAVIGTVIHSVENNMISIPSEFEVERKEITEKTYMAALQLKEIFED